MYPGQGSFQKFLVVAGVLMVPIMLMGKPLYILYKYVKLDLAVGIIMFRWLTLPTVQAAAGTCALRNHER